MGWSVVWGLVLCGLDGEADDAVCWLVGVLSVSETVTEEVDNDGSGVVKEVCGADVVGKVIVVNWDVPRTLVECVVLETVAVGAECVVCGVLAVVGVPEVVCTPGVPVVPLVGVVGRLVAGTDVD